MSLHKPAVDLADAPRTAFAGGNLGGESPDATDEVDGPPLIVCGSCGEPAGSTYAKACCTPDNLLEW